MAQGSERKGQSFQRGAQFTKQVENPGSLGMRLDIDMTREMTLSHWAAQNGRGAIGGGTARVSGEIP